MKKIIIILLICLSTILWAVRWSEPSYIINTDYSETSPFSAFTPNEELFVVWSSVCRNQYYDICFAQVTEDGTLTIPPTYIFNQEDLDNRSATVTVDSFGHAHVFSRKSYDDNKYDIYYTQIDTADGSYIVNPTQIIEPNTTNDPYMYAITDKYNNIHLLYCGFFITGGDEWETKQWESPLHAKIDPSGVLLSFDNIVIDNPDYDLDNRDKGIAVDSDGNVHIVFCICESQDRTVIYRKLDGNSGTPLTPLIDLGYQQLGFTYLAHEPYDHRPTICIDSLDQVHVSYIHFEDYITNIVHVILDKNGNIISDPRIVFTEEDDVGLSYSNFFVTDDDRLFLFCDCDQGIVVFEFNTNGDLVGEPEYLLDVMIGHRHMGPTGAVGNSGYIRVVGDQRVTDYDHDILYVHQIDDTVIDEVQLKAYTSDDGILLTWREEGGLIGSTWRLERGGDHLVNLSGDALYRYLDRDAEPNITHLYTLEA
ncbi:hypothetical protein KAU45_09385, partial [bacterium]|nr:hypothetical protein [bacterium]